MSRHPWADNRNDDTVFDQLDESQAVAENYINFVIDNTIPKSMTKDDIKTATDADPVLQQVISHIRNDDWYKSVKDPFINPFYNIRHELTITGNGILLRGHKIIIPEE